MSFIIKLVRHGESESNVGLVTAAQVGDHRVQLTENGKLQASQTGAQIGEAFIRNALLYRSPYQRTRQTMQHLLEGAGVDPDSVRIFEDPRLREIDPGYADYEKQREKRRKYGWFYYRFKGGEAPTDCYDRICTFLESFRRQSERKGAKSALIVSHGLTIRCFVMRYMHLSVEEFERLDNPHNCDVITIAPKDQLQNPQFISGNWGIEGLRLRQPSGSKKLSPATPAQPESDRASSTTSKETTNPQGLLPCGKSKTSGKAKSCKKCRKLKKAGSLKHSKKCKVRAG